MGFSVTVQGLSKSYSVGGQTIHALRNVDLTVAEGTAVAVVGPSGSGKSTLLHIVGAMDIPDEGVVKVEDYEVTALSRREQVDYRRRIGFVFQRFHLLPALTALDNVTSPLLPQKVSFDKRARGHELLEAVGLGSRGQSLPSELSGGEQQRVAIARALVNGPQLVLADEPTGNLDSRTGQEVLELLLQLEKDRRLTVLIATHDREVAERCDQTVTLNDGRRVAELL